MNMRKNHLSHKNKRTVSILMAIMIVISVILQPIPVSAQITAPSKLAAHHAYTVIDARTGEVLLSDKANKKVYPASTTKIMTAIVVLEKANPGKNIIITTKMLKALPAGCSKYGIKAGENYKVSTLLNMLLICSAGDAATCLAIGVFGSVNKCVVAMNKKCEALGLSGTHFDNPMGLDIGNGYKHNYTTANDMALITRYAMGMTAIKRIVERKSYLVYQSNGKKGRRIKNTNRFYYDVPYSKNMYTVIGTKSGTTKAAGSVFAATAIDKKGREVICVYMGKETSTNTFQDIRKILNTVYQAQADDDIALSTGRQEIGTEEEQVEIEFEENATFPLNVSIIDRDTAFELGENAGTISYTSSDESIVSVDSKGTVTINGVGTAVITIKAKNTAYHKAASGTVTFVINQSAQEF